MEARDEAARVDPADAAAPEDHGDAAPADAAAPENHAEEEANGEDGNINEEGKFVKFLKGLYDSIVDGSIPGMDSADHLLLIILRIIPTEKML